MLYFNSTKLYLIEILHQTTTRRRKLSYVRALYLIEILHQTTTARAPSARPLRCILLKFYIKPQQLFVQWYSISCCILLKFYIKPQPLWHTTKARRVVSYWNSTSNHNYGYCDAVGGCVVSYWNSTSNHNSECVIASATPLYLIEILHQTTTTVQHFLNQFLLYLIEILHQTTTRTPRRRSRPAVVSYWNSTSNHNDRFY